MGAQAERKHEELKPQVKPPEAKPKEKEENSKLHTKPIPLGKRIKQSAIDTAKMAGFIVAVPFIVFGVAFAAGCAPKDPISVKNPKKEKPEVEIPKKPIMTNKMPKKKEEELYWWPAFMITQNQDGNDEITDVSQGFVFPISQNPDHQFSSIDEIPQEMRDEMRSLVEEAADYSKFFFRDDAYTVVTENNIISFSEESGSGYGEEPRWFRLVDQDGKQIASCIDGCPTYDGLNLGQGHSGAAFHELLHDVWFTYLSDYYKEDFTNKINLFFNVLGSNWQADELIGAIYYAQYHNDPNDLSKSQQLGFESQFKGPELDNWANETLIDSGLSDSQINNIKQALKAYFYIRAEITFKDTYSFEQEIRNNWIVREGFAYLGAHYAVLDEIYNSQPPLNTRVMPAFMRPVYSNVMKIENLDRMLNSGFGFFGTEQSFQDLIPHIESFTNWMKNKYPELQNIGQ